MLKVENTVTPSPENWEAVIRGMYNGKGVRMVYPNSFEAYLSAHGKFVSCGTYPSREQAQEAVICTKLKLFEAGIIAHGDKLNEIVESVEKGYFASPKGNIYNRHGELMEGAIDRHGYRHVILNRKNCNVHRVIAETFIPNPDGYKCVNHKNGDKQNNCVSNLEWCSHSENTMHSFKNGLQKHIGGSCVYTDDEKEYIKQHLYESSEKIALALGRNKDTIRKYQYRFRREVSE